MSIPFSLRLTLRQVKRSPGFFAIAVAALALGIGANTAIFSAVEGVLPNFFDVLGVQPMLGRPFTAEEVTAKGRVVILNYDLWQRRYAGDPGIVGRSLMMDGEPATVVGVMPRGFFFSDKDTMYWTPAPFNPEDWKNRNRHYLEVVARLKLGVSVERAGRDM